jgi:holo-[acyl-carrier protein] synthase
MIIGIGIDIVRIKRMERWLINLKLLQRFFHPDELEYAMSLGNSAAQTLAARFAAKEAYGKALGTGLAGIKLGEITVINKNNGKPEIKLFGTAQNALINSGADKAHISITHEREFALAMVVLEGT